MRSKRLKTALATLAISASLFGGVIVTAPAASASTVTACQNGRLAGIYGAWYYVKHNWFENWVLNEHDGWEWVPGGQCV